jgi:hypothetical protein
LNRSSSWIFSATARSISSKSSSHGCALQNTCCNFVWTKLVKSSSNKRPSSGQKTASSSQALQAKASLASSVCSTLVASKPVRNVSRRRHLPSTGLQQPSTRKSTRPRIFCTGPFLPVVAGHEQPLVDRLVGHGGLQASKSFFTHFGRGYRGLEGGGPSNQHKARIVVKSIGSLGFTMVLSGSFKKALVPHETWVHNMIVH